MAEKCPVCGQDYTTGIDGVTQCKNGHQKKKYERLRAPTYPLGDTGDDAFYKKKPF